VLLSLLTEKVPGSALVLLAVYLYQVKKALQLELQWWYNNIEKAGYPLFTPNAKIGITLYTLHTSVRVKSWALKKEAEGLKLNQRTTLIV